MDTHHEEHENQIEDLKSTKYPTSPLDVVTGKFTPKKIVHEDRGFVIAVGEWREPPNAKGDPVIPESNVVAMRWHIPGEIGYPNGFGRPQWMKTPIDAARIESLDNPLLPHALKITLMGDPRKVHVGGWVRDDLDWHLVTYVYGDGDTMIQACGLGKSGPYPLDIGSIQKSGEGRSTMDLWYTEVMGGEPCVWLDARGIVEVTVRSTESMLWGLRNPENVYQASELILAPTGELWYSGANRPAVFDYMLADNALLGQLRWADIACKDNPKELSTTALRIQVHRFMQGINLPTIYAAMRDKKLSEYRRHFVDDLSGEQKQQVFAHDVVMGSAYYDLRETSFVK